MAEVVEKLLNFLGILGIPSIALNVYLYRQKRKFQKFSFKKELTKKEAELEEVISNQTEEYNTRLEEMKGRSLSRHALLTQKDENELFKMLQKSKPALKKINAEIEYLRKMIGLPPSLISDRSFFNKLKNSISNLYQKLRGGLGPRLLRNIRRFAGNKGQK